MTTNVPTSADHTPRVAILRQELLPHVQDLLRHSPPLNVTRVFATTGGMAAAALELVRAAVTAEGVDRRLREVLRRTAWIFRERTQGIHRTTLSTATSQALTEAPKLTEGAALRLSVARGDGNRESEVRAAQQLLVSLPLADPDEPSRRSKRRADAHLAFHAKLIAGCDDEALHDTGLRRSDTAERYDAWSGHTEQGAERVIATEHREHMDAALARDVDPAVSRLQQHLEQAPAPPLSTAVVPKRGTRGRGWAS